MRPFFLVGACLVPGLLMARAAMASMGYLTVNTASFASRTFEYGGHCSYTKETGGPPPYSAITWVFHSDHDCGSGVCGSQRYAVAKCRVVAGNTTYSHTGEAKLLRDGAVQNYDTTFWFQNGGGWFYDYPVNSGATGASDSVWKWRLTIQDEWGVDKDSNEVTL